MSDEARQPGSAGSPGAPPSAARDRAARQLVYAIGDVHGCYDLLRGLLIQITEDYVRHAAGRRPILVFCGDYVDRGPASAKVLEAMLWLRRRTEIDVHLLKGNHEQAMLEFIDTPDRGAPWIEFGGAQTLMSYGVNPPQFDEGPAGYPRARDDLLACMPASHLRLLSELSLMVVIGDYAFVHAGVRPGKSLAQQQEEDLLWIRKGFIDAESTFEKMIVHGHTWVDENPQVMTNRLGIDTGAYATGVLTAARFEGAGVEFIQARSEPASALTTIAKAEER